MFTEPAVTIVSSRYRTIDRILKQFIAKGEHYSKAANTIIIYNSDLAAHVYLQDHTLEEALQDRSIPSYVLQQMMALKTGALLDSRGGSCSAKEILPVPALLLYRISGGNSSRYVMPGHTIGVGILFRASITGVGIPKQ